MLARRFAHVHSRESWAVPAGSRCVRSMKAFATRRRSRDHNRLVSQHLEAVQAPDRLDLVCCLVSSYVPHTKAEEVMPCQHALGISLAKS